MKTEQTIRQLEQTRDRLLRSLNFFDLAPSAEAPAFLKLVNPALARTLLTGEHLPYDRDGLCPESAQFCRTLAEQSEKAARMVLLSDVDFLQKIKDGSDQLHHAPWGFVEGGFPVRVQGRIIHCLWSGRFREKAFTADERAQLAKSIGMTPSAIESLAANVPVYSRKEIDRFMELCRRLRVGLEQSITHHTRAEELMRQLVRSERTHSLGTLSGGVAHHFNNLLSIILGYASFIINRGKFAAEIEEALNKIIEAAQRGRRMTEEVLAFLGSDLEEESLSHVHEVLNGSLSLLESQFGAGIRVEKRLEAKDDAILAPASSIRQIVFNLLTNAVDSMPDGGVLAIGTSNVVMTQESGKQQKFLRLEVADSSIRLSGGDEPSRGKPAPRSVSTPDGIGLKLSSVYGMVGRLDGTVMMSSDPGSMTRVQILLPVAVSAEKSPAAEKTRRRITPSRVWVIDDDPIFCAMCRQLLSEEGHQVEFMTSGRELQEHWKSDAKRPDLMIMDFSMPEYNGLQLCEWLKHKGSQVPVILVSGFSTNQPDIQKALKMKKILFLQKPFTSRELSDKIDVVLGETLIGE